MIMVDAALRRRAEEGRPVRVAMVGAGFMGRPLADQIVNRVPGMELVAISNRRLEGAERAYAEAGIEDHGVVTSVSALEDAVARGRPAVTDDPQLLCAAEGIDAVFEVTGAVEFGAEVVLAAIAHGKHVVLMNAELDGTVGPILKVHADRAGVVLTSSDGDQPCVQMNLFRSVVGMGLEPLVIGNNKGLQDEHRNPTTQREFAERWGQKPEMVSSFADGTKMSFEQATVANATGMTIARRGMNGWGVDGAHFDELTGRYDVGALRDLGGIVDYVVGARPGPGVYVFAAEEDPRHRHYLNLYKLGEGPLYSFYHPYHLCHFEAPFSVARAVLFGDAAMAPAGGPRVEVVTTAKEDLQPGQVLDAMGGYLTYGQCETAAITDRDRLLPIGVAEGCRLSRPVARDAVLTYDDVEVPPGRLHDRLRREQAAHFASPVGPSLNR
jgi:predicted homoserine dehydrogenase-like protein